MSQRTRPECTNHEPQTTGFPWEHPKGYVTWCPNCGAMEADYGNGLEYMGRVGLDPDGGPEDWLYFPVIPLNWINVTVKLDEVGDGE